MITKKNTTKNAALEAKIKRIFVLKEQANFAKTKADACGTTSGIGLSPFTCGSNLILRPNNDSVLVGLEEQSGYFTESLNAYKEALEIEDSIRDSIQIFELRDYLVELEERGLLQGLSFCNYSYGYILKCNNLGTFVWHDGSIDRFEARIEHMGVLSDSYDVRVFDIDELKDLIFLYVNSYCGL